jgi:hypothetical protein
LKRIALPAHSSAWMRVMAESAALATLANACAGPFIGGVNMATFRIRPSM